METENTSEMTVTKRNALAPVTLRLVTETGGHHENAQQKGKYQKSEFYGIACYLQNRDFDGMHFRSVKGDDPKPLLSLP